MQSPAGWLMFNALCHTVAGQDQSSGVAGQYEDLPYPRITQQDWATERAWYVRETSCQRGNCRADQEERLVPLRSYNLVLGLLNHYLYQVGFSEIPLPLSYSALSASVLLCLCLPMCYSATLPLSASVCS